MSEDDIMGICIVTEEAIPPVQRFSLTQRIAETLGSEFEVHLVSVKSSLKDFPKKVHFHPVEVKGWDLFSLKQRARANIKLINQICRVCRQYEIDLVYGWWPAVFVGATLARKPFAVDMPEFIEEMYRSFDLPFPKVMGPLLRYFQTFIARKSQAVITESDIAADEWMKRKVSRDKIYCAPYGIEVEVFQSASANGIRPKYGIPEDRILVMYHGDIGFDDGVDLLIRAVKRLDVWCIIAGSGPIRYINYLKSLASERTIFTGWVPYPQIPSLLATADIYVAPFRSTLYTNTTFPLKQMEAMAAGKATICSDLKAFSKSVRNGYDIKLTKAGDLDELTSAIRELAENEDERKKLEHKARKTASEKFDWKIRACKEVQMLRDIMSKL